MKGDYRVRIRRDFTGDLIVTVRKGWRQIERFDTARKSSPDNHAHAEKVADDIIRRHAEAEIRNGDRPQRGRYRVSAQEARTGALERHVLGKP